MKAAAQILKFASLVAMTWLAGACVHSGQTPDFRRSRMDAEKSDFYQEMERGERHSLTTFGLPDN